MSDYIMINECDNVAVALKEINKSIIIDIGDVKISLNETIPQGHKFSVCDIPKDTLIIKYGYPIGVSKQSIPKGSLVHTHNMKTSLDGIMAYEYKPQINTIKNTSEKYFMGFQRDNGKVGIRNEIWIIPTVGCVNNVASKIAKCSEKFVRGNIDEVIAFPHPYGCSQLGEDQENTKKILADLVNHPNAGGVLVLGLGCENCNVDTIKKYIGEYDNRRVKFIVSQDCEDEVTDSIDAVKELIEYASEFKREQISCSELIIGMKCGGSDGLSGITANPTVGRFSDILISKGGSTILTEVPEMFGAETILMNRCANEQIFAKTVKLINEFKNYFMSYNQSIYENPSPGNKQGGISTLEDKSLGCTQKSGSATIEDVLGYGEIVKCKGLNLLSAPGNDLVASTALAASGAHMVLFTTGRGTPFASPVPTVKISSNTNLKNMKSNWIDFDCGRLLDGMELDELANELFDYVISVASGEKVKSEIMGFHDMAIFKNGVTL